MKKILIMSDTHGKHWYLEQILEQKNDFDLAIHLGDTEGAEDYIQAILNCPLEVVAGNNDFFASLPQEKIVDVFGHSALITHGHYYYVSTGPEYITREAYGRGVEVVMYGHTHRPYLDMSGDVIVLNPGSLSYPRQEGKLPSYAIMTIDDNDEIHIDIHYIEK